MMHILFLLWIVKGIRSVPGYGVRNSALIYYSELAPQLLEQKRLQIPIRKELSTSDPRI